MDDSPDDVECWRFVGVERLKVVHDQRSATFGVFGEDSTLHERTRRQVTCWHCSIELLADGVLWLRGCAAEAAKQWEVGGGSSCKIRTGRV